MSMAVADHTGQAWLQGFNEVGVQVFGMSADELVQIRVCVPMPYQSFYFIRLTCLVV
jgi:hypothetical protein